MKIIKRDGLVGLTIGKIAKEAIPPMDDAAPRFYFETMADVFAVIAEDGLAQLQRMFAKVEAEASGPKERLLLLGVAYVEFAISYRAHFLVIMSPQKWRSATRRARENALAHLRAAVAALNPALSENERRVLVVTCWSIVHGLATLQSDSGLHDLGLVTGRSRAALTTLTLEVLTELGEGLWSHVVEPPV